MFMHTVRVMLFHSSCLCACFFSQDISISVLLLLHELTDSDVLSEREEASVIVDAIVDKQVSNNGHHP